jgi:hypothetical protein
VPALGAQTGRRAGWAGAAGASSFARCCAGLWRLHFGSFLTGFTDVTQRTVFSSFTSALSTAVIPAKAPNPSEWAHNGLFPAASKHAGMDSRLRGNDGGLDGAFDSGFDSGFEVENDSASLGHLLRTHQFFEFKNHLTPGHLRGTAHRCTLGASFAC